MVYRSWLFSHWRHAAKVFAFQEYDSPVLENEGLYTRKSGEDIVNQLYAFEDQGGRRVCLRPEMTPSLGRMLLSKNIQRLYHQSHLNNNCNSKSSSNGSISSDCGERNEQREDSSEDAVNGKGNNVVATAAGGSSSSSSSSSGIFPLKWFSIPQCWRYEKTTRGRRRFVILLLVMLMCCVCVCVALLLSSLLTDVDDDDYYLFFCSNCIHLFHAYI